MSFMQTLGLSSKPQPTDNIFKRLLWPSIESKYDVDLIGQQGFYVCVVVGTISLLLMLTLGLLSTGLFTALFFYLAGCGVRERSVGAASMAFAIYLTNFVGSFIVGAMGNPFFQSFILMMLFANVRATVLSKRWSAQPTDGSDFTLEERSASTVMDRFSNKLPAKIWPKGKFLFFPLASLLLLLTIVGLVQMKQAASIKKDAPSAQTFEVR